MHVTASFSNEIRLRIEFGRASGQVGGGVIPGMYLSMVPVSRVVYYVRCLHRYRIFDAHEQ